MLLALERLPHALVGRIAAAFAAVQSDFLCPSIAGVNGTHIWPAGPAPIPVTVVWVRVPEYVVRIAKSISCKSIPSVALDAAAKPRVLAVVVGMMAMGMMTAVAAGVMAFSSGRGRRG
jgi:hypothetical protein